MDKVQKPNISVCHIHLWNTDCGQSESLQIMEVFFNFVFYTMYNHKLLICVQKIPNALLKGIKISLAMSQSDEHSFILNITFSWIWYTMDFKLNPRRYDC
jgi:hypothetical protein